MSEADPATPTGAPPAATCAPAAPQRPEASSDDETPQAAAADCVDGDAVPKAVEATSGQRPGTKVIARRMTGTVKWFDVKEGYGFIIRSDTQTDVFVHLSAISKNSRPKDRRGVAQGETVEFDLVQSERGLEAAAVTGPAGSKVEGSRYDRDRPRTCHRLRTRHGSRARRPARSPSCWRGPRGREQPEADEHSRAPADRAPRHWGPPGARRPPARAPRGAEDADEDRGAADHPREPRGGDGKHQVTYRCTHGARGPQAARDEGARDTERPLGPEWAITAGCSRGSSGGSRGARHRDPDRDQAPQDSATFGCRSDDRRRAAPRGPRCPSDRGGEPPAAVAETRPYPRAFAMRPRGRTQQPAVAAKAEPGTQAGEDGSAAAQGPRCRAPDRAPEQEARRFPPPRRAPADFRRSRPPGGPRAALHPCAGPPRGGRGPSSGWPSPAPWRSGIPGPRGSASTSQKPVARVVGRCWDAGPLQCIPLVRYGPSVCRGLRCHSPSPPEAKGRDPKGTEDEIQARRAETPDPPRREPSSSEEPSSGEEDPASTLVAQ